MDVGGITMGNQYKNVLIAVDGSEPAEKAFEKAVDIAKRDGARLIITNVVDSRSFATLEAYDRTLAERANEYARELINKYVESAKESGVTNVVKSVQYGSPKVVIAKDIAKEYDADLIVCGATGMNAVERFLMGSVSESITRHATC